jgi:hypothetical protein
MNQKMSTIAAIITAAALTGIISISPVLVYAEDTETSTDQDMRQKNVGSGDSFNFNCGENLIKAGVDEVCATFPTPTEVGCSADTQWDVTLQESIELFTPGGPVTLPPGTILCLLDGLGFQTATIPGSDIIVGVNVIAKDPNEPCPNPAITAKATSGTPPEGVMIGDIVCVDFAGG